MPSSTVRSRRLAALLRQYRHAAGLPQAAVARHLGRTVQWVSRVEHRDTCRPSVGDVRALAALYQVTDPGEVDRLAALAADARRPGWWHDYDLSAAHATFVGLEAEASAKLVWEPCLIPGLLQLPAYARAVIAAGPDDLPPGRVEELVKVRGERQKVLLRENPLMLTDIIDEAVLRRAVGTRELMRDQLRHLCEAAEADNVTVRVVPASAGAHPAMTGAFTILRYPDPADHDVVCCETPAGTVYAEDPGGVERWNRAFAHLEMLALPPGASMDLIARVAVSL